MVGNTSFTHAQPLAGTIEGSMGTLHYDTQEN
jgi:hypothetical protein